MLSSVDYLGHVISSEGLSPNPEKICAIVDAPALRDVQQLRSFLGLLNYYSKFLPNLSTTLAPLYQLLQAKVKWTWEKPHKEAFMEAKSQITSSGVLVHFDPQQELTLSCDTSLYGVRAVLSHRMVDGSEKPIAFASRSLTSAEKSYGQLEKEGLYSV